MMIQGELFITRDLRRSDEILTRFLKSLAKNDYRVISQENKIITAQEQLPAQFGCHPLHYSYKNPILPMNVYIIKYEKEVRV